MNQVTPTRTSEQTYQCRCVMRSPRDEPDKGRCPRSVNPDQPFCSDCEGRHLDSLLVVTGQVVVTIYTGR